MRNFPCRAAVRAVCSSIIERRKSAEEPNKRLTIDNKRIGVAMANVEDINVRGKSLVKPFTLDEEGLEAQIEYSRKVRDFRAVLSRAMAEKRGELDEIQAQTEYSMWMRCFRETLDEEGEVNYV
jgi:hypothetical protein